MRATAVPHAAAWRSCNPVLVLVGAPVLMSGPQQPLCWKLAISYSCQVLAFHNIVLSSFVAYFIVR